MINEDLPAIADQLSAEFGAQQAQGIKMEAESALDALLVANKGSKEQMDAVIGQLTGAGAGMMDQPMDAGLGAEEPMMDEPVADNVPAAAGPEEEPLGRAPVDAPEV